MCSRAGSAAPAATPSLQLDLRLDPDLVYQAALPLSGGVAVLGPNGSGKTRLLHALSGIAPAAGSIRCDSEDLNRLPAFRRNLALLGQEPLLFPHLDCLDNVAFPLQARGKRRHAARAQALADLTAAGLAHLARRPPATLSGGQAARVAILRALAARPALLLLDEPLSAIDVAAAEDVRAHLARVMATTPTLLVTHSLIDALTLCEWAVVIESGRIVEILPTNELAGAPPTEFAAQLAGVNRVPIDPGTAAAGPDGARPDAAARRRGWQAIPYGQVALHPAAEATGVAKDSAANPRGGLLSGTVRTVRATDLGTALVTVACPRGTAGPALSIRAAMPTAAAIALPPGTPVWVELRSPTP